MHTHARTSTSKMLHKGNEGLEAQTGPTATHSPREDTDIHGPEDKLVREVVGAGCVQCMRSVPAVLTEGEGSTRVLTAACRTCGYGGSSRGSTRS